MGTSLRTLITRRNTLVFALIAVTVGLYWPSLRSGFVSIDDGSLVTRNVLIQRPLDAQTLGHIFTSYDPELYVPLTFLSYHTDFSIGGLDPSVFHVHNLLLHILSVLLVFSLLLQLRAGRIAAFLGALLFAVHPLNSEAVLWISARKDLLSTFFGLLSCNCFLRWGFEGRSRWYYVALAAFGLGLLSKVTILFLPLFFFIIDPRDGTPRKKLASVAPFGFLGLLFAIIAIIGKLRTFGAAIPLWYYLLLAPKAFIQTLSHVVMPLKLSPIYPQLTAVHAASSEFWVPMLLTAIIVALIFSLRWIFPILWYGAILFLIGFAPSFLTFTKNGEIFITSDRYAYLAFVGAVWIIGRAVVRVHKVLVAKSRVVAHAWQLIIACAVIGLCVLSVERTAVWATDESLLRDVILKAPGHALAYNNLGVNFAQDSKYKEAEMYYQLSIEKNPHFILPRMNLASLLMRQGRTQEAEAAYRAAIEAIDRSRRIQSDDLTAYYFLAGILDARGDAAGALALYEEAAKLGSEIAEAQYNLAVTLQKNGKIPEAKEAYERVIALDSRFIDAHFNLAEILASGGDLEDALSHLDAVIRLQPDNAEAREHRENIRRILGR